MLGLIDFNHNLTENNEEKLMDVITQFRDKVREEARKLKNKDLFKLSDEIRNDILPKLGFQIEDVKSNIARWKRL